MAKDKNAPVIDPADDYFGAVLNCAVRYAIGRRTYMPSLVIGFIMPLIPHLNDKTLRCFDQDITEARWEGGYGDPDIDEPGWMRFHEAVRAERQRRGDTLYKKGNCIQQLIVDRLIANGVTVKEWISVKDRLPEQDGRYLCNYHFGEYPKMTFTQVLDYYATDIVPHFQHTLGDGSMKVTHWMEIPKMPQPPKGG